MKLQFSPSALSTLATAIGEPSEDLAHDTRRAIEGIRDAGYPTLTRKDVTTVLYTMGWAKPIDWVTIRDIVSKLKKASGRGVYQTETTLDAPPTEEETPKKKRRVIVIHEEPTVTTRWFEKEIRDNGLLDSVARRLSGQFPYETFRDLRSMAGEKIAKLSAQGYCDEKILAGNPPSIGAVTYWCKQYVVNELTKMAQDAHLRETKGVRTTLERNRRKEEGRDHIHEDSRNRVGTHKVHRRRTDSGEIREEIIEVEPAESLAALMTEDELSLARDIVRVRRGRRAERYARVFDHLMEGRDKKQIGEIEEIPEGQASGLVQKVRSDLRAGPELLQVALKVLKLVAEEPFSTRGEIEEEVTTESTEPGQALDLLKMRGLVEEAKGESFLVSQWGETSLMAGEIH